MEYLPPSPFESPKQPDQSGSKETSKKKKKKTTHIPLPVEKTDAKAAENRAEKSRSPLEYLFAKHEADKEAQAEITAETDKTEEAEKSSDQSEGELNGNDEIFLDHSEELLADEQRLPEPVSEIAAEHSEATRTLSEALEIPDFRAAGSEVWQPAEEDFVKTPETPVTDTDPLAADEAVVRDTMTYEPVETEPGATLDRHMIDPSLRYGEEIAAERHRAESLQPITEENVNDAYDRGKKRGVSHGVAAGGLAGWWLGHRGKKKALQEANNEIIKRDKEIEGLKAEQFNITTRLDEVKRTQAHLEAAAKQPADMRIAPQIVGSEVLRAEVLQAAAPEQSVSLSTAEKPAINSHEQPKTKPELPPEDQEISEETYQVPAGRRVEMSAWHRMEVDSKTGKLVENPEVDYGEAFKQEQKQELLTGKPARESTAATMGHAVLMSPVPVPTRPVTQYGQPAPKVSAPRRSPLQVYKQNQVYIKQQLTRRTSDPMTWLIAGAIVVVLVISGIL